MQTQICFCCILLTQIAPNRFTKTTFRLKQRTAYLKAPLLFILPFFRIFSYYIYKLQHINYNIINLYKEGFL